MKKFQKVVSRIMAVAMAAMLLTACGNNNTSSQGNDQGESKWPSGSVQYFVPATAGGGTDLTARIFTQWLEEKTGKGQVVTNQVDGSGAVACANVKNAKADGLTLLFAHTGSLVSCATGTIQANMAEDFRTIAYMPSKSYYCLVVNAKSDYQTIDDLINDAKDNKGQVTMGVALGASTHIMAASLAMDTGVEFNYVEAGADTEKISALAGGHIQATLVNNNNAKQFVESGDVRVLAVMSGDDSRSETFPDIPNLAELGYSHCNYSVDFVVWGPKSMSDADVQKINEYFKEAVADSKVTEQLTNLNMNITECLSVEDGMARLESVDANFRTILGEIGLVK